MLHSWYCRLTEQLEKEKSVCAILEDKRYHFSTIKLHYPSSRQGWFLQRTSSSNAQKHTRIFYFLLLLNSATFIATPSKVPDILRIFRTMAYNLHCVKSVQALCTQCYYVVEVYSRKNLQEISCKCWEEVFLSNNWRNLHQVLDNGKCVPDTFSEDFTAVTQNASTTLSVRLLLRFKSCL